MVPTAFKTADYEEPQTSLYYLVTADGLFLVRKTSLFTSISRALGVPGLEPQQAALALRFGKIPGSVMERVYGFFDWAWRRWRSEAILFLYYAPETGAFLLDAPPQTIQFYYRSGQWHPEGRVAYCALPRPPGYLKLGDIHSHGRFPAFFSAQDDRDDCEEGLKIVMGRLDGEEPEVEASFVVGRNRFALRPDDILEEFAVPMPPPRLWIDRVHCQYESGN